MTQQPRMERRDRLTPVGLLRYAPPPRTLSQVQFDRVVVMLEHAKEAIRDERSLEKC